MFDHIRVLVDITYWSFLPRMGRTWYGWWFWFLCFHCHITTKEYQLKDKH